MKQLYSPTQLVPTQELVKQVGPPPQLRSKNRNNSVAVPQVNGLQVQSKSLRNQK